MSDKANVKGQRIPSGSPGAFGAKTEEAPVQGKKKQQFFRSDTYFTVCIYVFLLVVCSALAVKAIFSFDDVRRVVAGWLRAISPFLIALLIAYILGPFVEAANRLLKKVFKKMPDKPRMVLSMLVVYLVALGMVISLLVYVLPEVVNNLADMIRQVPAVYKAVLDFVEKLQTHFPDYDFAPFMDMLTNTQTDLVSSLQEISANLIPVLYTASVSIVSWAANFLIAMVVSVYMLYGRRQLLRIFKICVYTVVPRKNVPLVREVLYDCHRIFGQYVTSKMVDSLIIGVLCYILMTILRLPYVFLISVVVGITNMIPYFGPFIGAVPGIVIMLVVSPVKALVFAVMILCLQQFDGLYLGPKLMGNSVGMKPIWIIFAITLGGKFFGVVGMFLGVPAVAIMAYLLERLVRHKLKEKNMTMEEIT
ncbi:MAG: AI-2E family transporter [Lachnospiraceae bacterium]|nr:AI-2E family transporter [Lachnospiraceae bacterium]